MFVLRPRVKIMRWKKTSAEEKSTDSFDYEGF